MRTLSTIAPELASEVRRVLEAEGRAELAATIDTSEVERCTVDTEVEAGYIRFFRPESDYSRELASPVASTLAFAAPHWFNIDVDYDDAPVGIEILGRPDVLDVLRNERAP